MEKRTRRTARAGKRHNVRRARVVREPVATEPPAGAPDNRLRRTCFDCIFCVSSVVLWAQTLLSGFPMLGQCANQPDAPGQMRRIPLTPCRNFRAKPYRVEPPQPPNDSIRYIPLTRGLHAIVDAEDYEWLSQYKWHANRTNGSGTIYAARNVGRGSQLMHRMIMRPPQGMVVDHINGNGLDNRHCNLRIVPPAVNAQNRRKRAGTKSRFIGVSPCGNKWQAFIARRYLGRFDDEVEAAKVRDREAIKQYGQRAWLNFPPEAPQDEGQ